MRTASAHVCDRLRDQAARHRGQRAHLGGLNTGCSGLGKRCGSRLQGLGDVDRVPQELLAGLRQLGAGPAPLDQPTAGQHLELG